MLHRMLFLAIVFALVMSLGFVVACGDDDDDDDDYDGDPDKSACAEYQQACDIEADHFCSGFYGLSECLDAAADDLFACVDNDCDMYLECTDEYTDVALDC
jgi:hypothetical protein